MNVREGDKSTPSRGLYLQNEVSSGDDLMAQLEPGL